MPAAPPLHDLLLGPVVDVVAEHFEVGHPFRGAGGSAADPLKRGATVVEKGIELRQALRPAGGLVDGAVAGIPVIDRTRGVGGFSLEGPDFVLSWDPGPAFCHPGVPGQALRHLRSREVRNAPAVQTVGQLAQVVEHVKVRRAQSFCQNRLHGGVGALLRVTDQVGAEPCQQGQREQDQNDEQGGGAALKHAARLKI